jgi:hypothetical protein
MNIYQIDKELMDLIDPETGELKDELAFEELQMERDRKIENVALWWKNEQADVAAIKAEIAALAARRDSHMKTADRLEKYLADALKGDQFETPKVAVKWRASSSVEVYSMDELPEQFYKTVTSYSPDKTAIKDALKMGEEVPGAVIISKQNIQIK